MRQANVMMCGAAMHSLHPHSVRRELGYLCQSYFG